MADSVSTVRRPRPTGGGRLDSVLVGLLLLVVAAASAAVFLLALGLVDGDRVIADDGLREALLGWTTGEGAAWTRAAVASGSLLLGLLALWGLIRKLAPGTGARAGHGAPSSAVHVLVADDLGVVLVAREGIEGIARQAVQGATGVIDADVMVRSRGPDAVGLKVDALVMPGADLQRAGAQARDRAREAVERLVGLGVQEVSIKLEVVEPEDLERTVL